LGSSDSESKAFGNVTILAARKWWAIVVESSLLVAFGLIVILLLTSVDSVDLQGFVFLLALMLSAGGICLIVFGFKRKGWGRLRLVIIAEGILGVLVLLVDWVLNISVSEYRVREDYLVMLMATWALASAALVLLWWRASSRDGKVAAGQYVTIGSLLSFFSYLALAIALLVIGSFKLTNDYSDWRSNIIILSLMLVVIGLARSTVALERVDAHKVVKSLGRRWAIGVFLLLTGSFLLLIGLFAYSYRDLVQVYDEVLGITYPRWDYVYQDAAWALLSIGAVLLLIGAILLVTGWKARSAKLKTRTLAVGVVAILLVEVLAAMLIVNPGALDMGSNRWDMQPGDYLNYNYSSIIHVQHNNLTTGELVNFTTDYLNYTVITKVLEVSGRSDVYMSAFMEFEGAISFTSIYKMPKDADTLEINQPMIEPTYIRDEVITTPWGPRLCQRYSVQGHVNYDGLYSCDEWIKDGIVLMMISDYKYSYNYDEPKEWVFRHDVSLVTDTSLEEVTEGPSDLGGPPVSAWSPAVGDALNYSWSPGGMGQDTTWRYLVRDVSTSRMLMNLSIYSQGDPSELISAGERWCSTNDTTMGVALYPATSQGLFSVSLIGNESISTPWGQLECSHYYVTHILEDSDTYTREDLYVRDGVLLKLESFGLGQYSMTLAETNLELG